ncbi:YrhB domain-containing protein [Streptomyces sp. NPDC051098]|uniref:YrhB domain-containing protein n=1 Tax=Streptomyces sp. NPDC051098 TaxID=3155411 RepID=UPI00342CD042
MWSDMLGWLIICQSPRYARTRDPADALVGHGPFLVDALEGSLHMVHQQFCSDGQEWEEQYREKVRGELPPRELDEEVRRLTRAGAGSTRAGRCAAPGEG